MGAAGLPGAHEGSFFSRWLGCSPASLLQMFNALERVPEGKEWIERNRSKLSKLRMAMDTQTSNDSEITNAQALSDLTNVLQRLGVDPKALENLDLFDMRIGLIAMSGVRVKSAELAAWVSPCQASSSAAKLLPLCQVSDC